MNYRETELDIERHTNESVVNPTFNPTKDWLGKNYILWKFSFTDLPDVLIVIIIIAITVISAFINLLVLIRSQFINSLLQMFSGHQKQLLTDSGQKETSIIELFY